MERDIFEYFREMTQKYYGRVDEKLVKYDLVKGQAHLLALIKDNNGCTQKDLANLVGVKYSSMSERLDKLERNGYIERSVDEDNAKYKRITVTSEGKTAVIQCRRILKDFEANLFKGMTKKDQKQLEAYLIKMINNVSK